MTGIDSNDGQMEPLVYAALGGVFLFLVVFLQTSLGYSALQAGGHWVHLRMCQECGHLGCCDSSPNRHATARGHTTEHPLVRSFEPGEGWFYCYPDELVFELDGAPPAPSHS